MCWHVPVSLDVCTYWVCNFTRGLCAGRGLAGVAGVGGGWGGGGRVEENGSAEGGGFAPPLPACRLKEGALPLLSGPGPRPQVRNIDLSPGRARHTQTGMGPGRSLKLQLKGGGEGGVGGMMRTGLEL